MALLKKLSHLNLLQPLRSRVGVVGIHPSSVVALLDRVHQRISVPAESEGAATLLEGEEFGLDTQGIAWTVAQVVGGSVAALGWRQPYRLTSLTVDRQRLAALVDWPQGEPFA